MTGIQSTAHLSMFQWRGNEGRVWEFLPARADRRRVTTPDVIAVNLGLTVQQVGDALASLERVGRIVRDQQDGSRTGWHRVTLAPALVVVEREPDLFGESA
jgi:alkylated DNA nucleotide flippase Atl1